MQYAFCFPVNQLMTPLLQGKITNRLEIVELIKLTVEVRFSVYVNSDSYRVIDFRMYRLDNSICIRAIKNETKFIIVKFMDF